MLFNNSDLVELEKYVAAFRVWEEYDDTHLESDNPWFVDESSVEYFANRPHLLLPLGFDESKAIIDPGDVWYYEDKKNNEWIKQAICPADKLRKHYGINTIDFTFFTEYLYRRIASGAWYWFEGLDRDTLKFRGPKRDPMLNISIDELFSKIKNLITSPDPVPRTIWLPSIWTPKIQKETNLSESIIILLEEIKSEKKELHKIKPRQLEELIAELLRRQGMKIHVTPQTRDGGRDIIARSELIPGEPMELAIEVKQKPVVGIDDLYKALKANEDYPALLIATSGRFSAGVINERHKSRNQLRLFLKDGIAISQWIDIYGKKFKNGE